VAWQDSHFSLSYDRPSTVAVSQPEIADRPESKPGDRDYFETMCRIISLTLEVVRGRMLSPHFHMSFKTIQTYKQRIQQMLAEAAPHLRDRKYCLTSTDHLQRLALKVHASYITSELCRPALKAEADKNDPLLPIVRRDCVESLIGTVESYIELHSFSTHGSRAWITLQRAISCAFLLAVIDEGKTEPKVRDLLHELEIIISERASAEGGFETTENTVAAAAPGESMSSPANVTQNTRMTAGHTFHGITKAHLSVSDSFQEPKMASAPANITMDTQAQWAKPLIRSLRALQKMNLAFNTYGAQPGSSTGAYGQSDSQTALPQSVYGHNLSVTAPSSYTPNMGSLPPPTPESSSSSDWTYPTLLDRAAEYIHPPLWG
jgi:hypothetical protein